MANDEEMTHSLAFEELREQVRQQQLRNMMIPCAKERANALQAQKHEGSSVQDCKASDGVSDNERLCSRAASTSRSASDKVQLAWDVPARRGGTGSDVLRAPGHVPGGILSETRSDRPVQGEGSAAYPDAVVPYGPEHNVKSMRLRADDDQRSVAGSSTSDRTLPPMPVPGRQSPSRYPFRLNVSSSQKGLKARLDYGAHVCVISRDAVEYLGLTPCEQAPLEIRGVSPSSVWSDTIVKLTFQFDCYPKIFKAWLFVIPGNCLVTIDVLLGENFIDEFKFFMPGGILTEILQAQAGASACRWTVSPAPLLK
jgi:hypothetical protein